MNYGSLPRLERKGLMARFPRASVIVYPQVGHAPHWEQPERFVSDLVAFLSGQAVGQPSGPGL